MRNLYFAYAASGRALPCTRNFFVKKLSKNFITPAGGTEKQRVIILSLLHQTKLASICKMHIHLFRFAA
ncbi:hypothetical protein D3Z52_13160 [Clostridiaceae bacterium]|nr:hypothetical protein [Clostridiaceae bacterium]